ncbi:hypothetical protein F4680DRAFT_242763 [Xylaria scruposa]|nr:hypothetical protein F4680DRAFT_242763 [Xylaria scruposa]
MPVETDSSNLAPDQQADSLAALQQSVAELTATVQALTKGMQAMEARLTTSFDKTIREGQLDWANRLSSSFRDTIKKKLGALKHSLRDTIDDCDFNNRARLWNYSVRSPETEIRQLRNITTHERVDLPKTRKELAKLKVPEVTAILYALRQQPDSRTDHRLDQLRDFIGLPF